MSGPSPRTAIYVLCSEEEGQVEVFREDMEEALSFLADCRDDPDLAAQRIRCEERLKAPAVQKAALEFLGVMRGLREAAAGGAEALAKAERRLGVEAYQDFLVLEICRKALFDRTHDPSVRGTDLESAFRLEEALREPLDRVDRALFRLRFAAGLEGRFLGEEA